MIKSYLLCDQFQNSVSTSISIQAELGPAQLSLYICLSFNSVSVLEIDENLMREPVRNLFHPTAEDCLLNERIKEEMEKEKEGCWTAIYIMFALLVLLVVALSTALICFLR